MPIATSWEVQAHCSWGLCQNRITTTAYHYLCYDYENGLTDEIQYDTPKDWQFDGERFMCPDCRKKGYPNHANVYV
jgi:hypothetical protein